MKPEYQIKTERLGLRRWSQDDIRPFAEMNQNPQVMRYFPNRLTAPQTEQFIRSIEHHFDTYGYGLYAADLITTGAFIGFIGLYTAVFKSDFTPCTEIGWRLDSHYWKSGYATEGAKACLHQAFTEYHLENVFSFTSIINKPSIAVMKRIGLRLNREFNHPNIQAEHELCKHVLYSLSKAEYAQHDF